ncbi:5,10-methylenetetrahydrofolate reductase [hydrothermal vent metagenome]|uniref:methylenetetrahydrofolate reductase (NADH) n=1 Tax=hydrothermal vent metagenome TaxID=652676 RepID=A0A3B0TZB9_9ZZZZ
MKNKQSAIGETGQAGQAGRRKFDISFEFFPPKTEAAEKRFWASMEKLTPLKPRFVSVTYGAGGSTRERTLRMVSCITKETGIEAAAHLTCVGASRGEVDDVVRQYAQAGVHRIVAIRGDPSGGVGHEFIAHPDGYANAAELVKGIKAIGDFDVSVAAYPEKHPESATWEDEIDNLKRKIDAGADRAITQMFFDNAHYWRLMERVEKAQISLPIVPGIQPIHNFAQVASFAKKCGADVPDWLASRFEGLENDPETQALVAALVAGQQVAELANGGVSQFHFFTMNHASQVMALVRVLDQEPKNDNNA